MPPSSGAQQPLWHCEPMVQAIRQATPIPPGAGPVSTQKFWPVAKPQQSPFVMHGSRSSAQVPPQSDAGPQTRALPPMSDAQHPL